MLPQADNPGPATNPKKFYASQQMEGIITMGLTREIIEEQNNLHESKLPSLPAISILVSLSGAGGLGCTPWIELSMEAAVEHVWSLTQFYSVSFHNQGSQ